MATSITSREHGFNPDTGPEAPTFTRRVSFHVRDHVFAFDVTFPIYMREKLRSEDWDYVIRQSQAKAIDLLAAAAMEGHIRTKVGIVDDAVAKFFKNTLYDRYLNWMQQSGLEATEVPKCMETTY